MVKNLTYSAGLGASDHVILEFDFSCYSLQRKQPGNRLDLSRANFKLLNNRLRSINWDCLHHLDFSNSYAFFKAHIQECIEEAVPLSRPPCKKKKHLHQPKSAANEENQRISLEAVCIF